MTEGVDSRRRRLLVVGGVLVVAVVLIVGFVLLRGDDDEAPPVEPPLPTEPAADVIARFQAAPCSLIASAEVEAATGREAEQNTGGPKVLCTYDLADEPVGDVVTAQVSGPMTKKQFDLLVADAELVPGDIVPLYWLPGGGTGGRVVGRKDFVMVEVGVRITATDTGDLQEIGQQLADQALARIPPNTDAAGTTPPDAGEETCAVVGTDDVAEVLGPSTEALVSVNEDACSFRAGESYASVERIGGDLPELDQIVRSSTSDDGETITWKRSDVDLGDEAVLLTDPDDEAGTAELYVLEDDVLFHILVTGADDPRETTEQLAELVLG